MSTYTLQGIKVTWSETQNDTPLSASATTLSIVAPDTTTGFTYEIIYYDDYTYEAGDFRDVDVSANIYGFELGGTYYPETDDAGTFDTAIGRISWSGNTTYVMTFFEPDSNTDYMFVIGGVALPEMTTLTEFQNFMTTINFNATGGVTSGAYGPGSFISFAAMPDVVITETLVPSQNIVGTLGNDVLSGGDGDDTINPLSNYQGEDRVDGGGGSDSIILSDTTLDSWVVLAYNDFDGVTFNIDGFANTASVDKGNGDVDTITDINTPLNWDSYGFGLYGSSGDDTFNLSIADGQWLDLRGGGGSNTYNLDIEGLVRVSYHWDGASAPSTGIVADLGAGTVSNNGYGSSDTFNVTDSGGHLQLRGTNFGDDITGSSMGEDYILRGGNDSLDGGAGFDEVRYDRSGYDTGVTVDLAGGNASGTWNGAAFYDTLSNIEAVRGSSFDDVITGNDQDNLLRGRDGADTLISNEGNDTLMGEDGDDTYEVNGAGTGTVQIDDHLGMDRLILIGPDDGELQGEITYDLFSGVYSFEFFGGRTVELTEGTYGYSSVQDVTMTDESDTFSADFVLVNDDFSATQSNYLLAGSANADYFQMGNFADQGDALVFLGDGGDFIEIGDGYGSTVDAGADNDTVVGGDGDDYILGRDGDDSLYGSEGNDFIDGGAGGDFIDGGAGFDTVSYESATRSVRVDLQNSAFMYNDAVGDSFANVEAYQTGGTIDQLRGDTNANIFYTGGLSDRLYGRAGDDYLFGETGADAFYGGTGSDVMTGGDDAGRRDRYIYFNIVESGVGAGNRDIITDFVSGEDRIEIRRFDANAILGGPKAAFNFVGDAGLSGIAGELTYVHQGGSTIVQADVTGDGVADFEIELLGTMDLIVTDFYI